MKFYIESVSSNYHFNGYIYSSQLSDYQMNKLGLRRSSKFDLEIEVEGNFLVSWEEDEFKIKIEAMDAFGAPTGKTYDSFQNGIKKTVYCQHCIDLLPFVDKNHVSEQIENLGHVLEWREDWLLSKIELQDRLGE